MDKNGFLIIASAIVWGAVLVSCSMVLKGTPFKEKINLIILGGTLFHMFVIWLPLGRKARENKKK